ncbi:MAG TPA: calcium-binding protein [Gaiellaceae bacterium]
MAALVMVGSASAHGKARRYRMERPRLVHHTLFVIGTPGDDQITLRLKAGDPEILQVDAGADGSADFSRHIEPIDAIVVDAGAGNDTVRIDDGNGAFTNSIPTTIAGGSGDDALFGGAGAELFLGGSGNDRVDGNGGNDIADLGAGDDTFVWDPGDGSDTIEGGDGRNDTLIFNGAAADDQVSLSANGSHLTFFRNPGNVTMDTHGVEQVDFNALGGSDLVTVNDLAGTDVGGVLVDLAGALGGTTADGQPDRVVVNGTNGDDSFAVDGDATDIREIATGLGAPVEILHADAGSDSLEINGLDGLDTVEAGGLAPNTIQLLFDGIAIP